MAHTYSGNPAASDLDWIRFTIADTGPNYSGDPWEFHDEEINGQLATDAGNRVIAAGHLLLVWSRRIGHTPDFHIGRFGESRTAAAKFLQDKANELLNSAMAGIGAYVGGISVADKAAKESDTDRTTSGVKRGMGDNPDAGW